MRHIAQSQRRHQATKYHHAKCSACWLVCDIVKAIDAARLVMRIAQNTAEVIHMVYYINGRRMTHQDAAWYLATLAAGTNGAAAAALLDMIWDYLFTVKPGEARIYSNMRISCGRV